MQSVVLAGGSSEGQGERRKPLMFGSAVVVVVMMIGALLAPSNNSVLVTSGELFTEARELFDPSAVSAEELALLDQLAVVGDGLVLETANGPMDASFMLAGPAFIHGETPFSIATFTYQGEAVAAVAPVAEGDRILYERGDVTEWWQAVGSAYQQGWTVAAAPADGSTDLSLLVGFGNAAPLAESDTIVRLLLSDNSVVWYRDLIAFDANGTDLPATMTVDGSNVRIDVDAAGAVYPVTIDPIVDADQEIQPPVSATGDRFGETIATDGDFMIVSVSGDDTTSANNGRAEVYEWVAGDWTLRSVLTNPSVGNTEFGWDVDINVTAGLAVVGAPGDDENGEDSGAAHIFVQNPDETWGFKQTIYQCDPTTSCGDSAQGGFDGREFGMSVAVSDTSSVVVGAPGSPGLTGLPAVPDEGTVFVFDPIGLAGEWLTNADRNFDPFTQAAGDRFGTAVDITADGGIVLAGAPGEDLGGFTDRGRLYTFVLDTGVWGLGDATQSDGGDGLEFSSSVAIGTATNGTIIAVGGAPWRSREDPNGASGFAGRARVFTVNSGGDFGAIAFGNLSSPVADDGFGFSVAFDDSNNRVIVGAPFNNGAAPNRERGLVSVFEYDPDNNQMVDADLSLSADTFPLPSDWPTNTGDDNYGYSVAAGPSAASDTYVVGSPGDSSTAIASPASGRVTTTAPEASSVLTTTVTASTTAAALYENGFAVAISGNLMAISSIGDGAGGVESGLVYAYSRLTSTSPWVLDEVLTDPSATAGIDSDFGFSLDLENDFLAVGAPGGDGSVAVYQHDGSNWNLREAIEGNGTSEDTFGTDVAITPSGEYLFVAVPGFDNAAPTCTDCGAVRTYQWNTAVTPQYLVRDTAVNTDPTIEYGLSIDVDRSPDLDATQRLVIGRTSSDAFNRQIETWLVDTSLATPTLAFEAFVVAPEGIGQSVAIDGSRIAAAASDGASDAVYVADINEANSTWIPRALYIGDLATDSPFSPNSFVDVAGDTIVVGRAGDGGEVGIFYNHPSYGWGLADPGLGWADGPRDRIQPSGRAVADKIGRAVAVDGLAASKSIVIGAPGDDTQSAEAGAAYASAFTESGTTFPNKIEPVTFGSGQFGADLAASGDRAVVAEPLTGRVHILELDGEWSITQTFDEPNVVAVDIEGTRMVVASSNGDVVYYEETCSPTCSFGSVGGTTLAANGNPTTVLLSGNDVFVGKNSINAPLVRLSWLETGPGTERAPAGIFAGEQTGASLAIDGNLLFVGAPRWDNAPDDEAGRVYIYDTTTDTFTGTIEATTPGILFGFSLAADSGRLVVGYPGAESPLSGAPAVGVVETYTALTTTGGVLEEVIANADTGTSDALGRAVDIDGDVMVIGAPAQPVSGVGRTGQIYTYGFDGLQWLFDRSYGAPDPENNDVFGRAVAITGLEVLAGAPFDDNSKGNDAGAVYAFDASPATPVNKVVPFTTADDIRFGSAISMIEGMAAVAEPGTNRMQILSQESSEWFIDLTFTYPSAVVDVDLREDKRLAVLLDDGTARLYEEDCSEGCFGFDQIASTPAVASGTASTIKIAGDSVLIASPAAGAGPSYMSKFDLNTGAPQTIEQPPGVENVDDFGRGLAVFGGVAFVGAPLFDGGAGTDTGNVWVYDIESGTVLFNFRPVGVANTAYFGASIDADGDTVVIGAPGVDGDGVAYVYTYSDLISPTVTLEQTLEPTGGSGLSGWGFSSAIEGGTIILGATGYEESGAAFRDGTAVSFIFDGTSWVQTDQFDANDGTEGDQFGFAVDIAGNDVLVGANLDDNFRGTDAGAVYYFAATPAPEPPDNPTLSFDLNLDDPLQSSVAVAPTGIAVSDFNPIVLEDASENDTSIAAASLGETDIAESPISALPISALPISALAQNGTSPLNSIPLVNISLDTPGGWPAILAGTDLADVPLVDLTLGDVVNNATADSNLASTPISALEVNGTPISALPISALLLGELPISALDAADPDTDWCSILATYLPGADCNTTSLVEATLVGTPISALPISALPISALPISALDPQALPISALPISALDLAESPISALPISALPISALPISALPISALPISALPISALPISALNLNASPISALELNAAPISALELRNVPISALAPQGTPISALPISALPISALLLQDVPLDQIPVEGDWCDVLADLEGYDCSFASNETAFLASTTINDLGVRGVPISALPISALPISALPISALPISALPISALPISALPVSALPISALDIGDTPISALDVPNLASVPISALDLQGSPISALPISALDLGASPISALPISALPISALPISALEISSLVVNGTPISALPISALDISSTPISALPISALPISALGIDCDLVDCDVDTLYDALLNGAIPGTVTIGQLRPFLSGIRLGDLAEEIADAIPGATLQDVIDAAASSPLTLSQLSELDDLTLGDLPASDPLVQALLLGDFASALWSITLGDLIGVLLDPTTGDPFDDFDVEDALSQLIDALPGDPTLADFEATGDLTLQDILDGDTQDFTLADLGPILGLIHITDLANVDAVAGVIGDLSDEELGDITLLDLLGLTEIDTLTLGELFDAANAANALVGFDVGDLLLALLGVDAAPFSELDFTEVETGDLPEGLISPVTFVAGLEVRDTSLEKTVKLIAQLPATASYVPGSATVSDDAGTTFESEPIVGANTLTWTLNRAKPNTPIAVSFDVKPTVTIGATNISATATVVGSDAAGAASASIDVREGIEPNDFNPETTLANQDSVYLTYISSETDNDVFEISVLENDQLAIQLSSLTADLDFALYGRPADTTVGTALTDESDESPLEPITDPDQEGADTEPLNDFRRLDEEDPSLQFIDLSNSPGTETELLVTSALPAGTYYVQVFGANGATNLEPAALQIQILEADERPNCVANGAIDGGNIGNFPALAGSTANTLILVNEQRTEALFPGEWADLETEINELVTYLEDPLNDELGIEPVVVSVDGDGTIQSAYQTWDQDGTCSPESANAVVEAIISQAVEPLRGTLEHIVIVGGDQVIPMARLTDVTEVANEYDYRHEFIGDNAIGANVTDINAFSATFWDRQYLSDEPYGESAARSLGNRFLYVSDIALGRMVETPDEIRASLQHFQDFNGSLQADTAAILGYDFLIDSSNEIADDFTEVLGAANVDRDLADGFVGDPAANVAWSSVDAEGKVIPAGGPADLISLNGHFDHYRALPADGDQVPPGTTPNFLAETVANATDLTPGLLQGSIIFSMGCHGGLSVSDGQILDTNGDWAQTFAADQAIFVGNTGFGYGDTEAVAYTEKLMALFAEQAIRPVQLPSGTTTIGQALTFAKNEYASDLSVFSVYDEKALMESTFYGLPFYRVGAPPVAADPIPDNMTNADSTGNQSLTITAAPLNDENSTAIGTFYSNPDENLDPQTIIAPGMPIQPSQSFDVSVVDEAETTELATVARGALVLDMTSTYQSGVDPVVSAVIFNESDDAPEPPLGSIVFPAKPVTINSSTTPGGDRQNLVLATGQFDSDGSVQRLDDDIDVVVYYADESDLDYTAPTIGAVESTLEATPAGAELTVTLTATDGGGDDAPVVTRVYLLIAGNPGVGTVDWVGLDLAKDPSSNEWSGSALLPLGTTLAEYVVGAVDGSGNVGYATNKARNFNEDDTVVPDLPTPGLTVTVSDENFDVDSGWYTGSVDVTVDSGGLAATYLRQPGGVVTPVPPGGVFTISRNGVNRVTVTRSNGQAITQTIRIDTTAPTVSIAPPANGAIFSETAVPKVGFVCQDPSLTSCTATVDGVAILNADPLPATVGPHTVSVTARDALGNEVIATAGYTVESDGPIGDPPMITDVEIDGVALPGEPIDIFGEFVDGVGPYSIAVDWGNGGDTCPGDGTCTIEPPAAGMPGTFEASYTYPVGGAYSVEVTITDSTGRSVSTTLTTATCTIVGTNSNNFIYGTSGSDVICGLGGNDWINGRGGADLIFGGVGNDVIRGGWGADIIFGGRGNDTLLGQDGNDTLIGGRDHDLLIGGSGRDVLKGRSGRDTLLGGSGNDTLVGNLGDDTLYGGGGADDILGGRGDDFISGWYGNDTINGGSGNDTIFAGWGDDTIVGGAGDDWVSAGSGNDTVDGGDDDDDLRGNWGDDTIEGGDGTDRCRGGYGSDQLTGCEL